MFALYRIGSGILPRVDDIAIRLIGNDVLSQAIKTHRARRGWSLREVARRSGISHSAISKVERGELSLTYDKLEQLAVGLEIEISELFNAPDELPGLRPMTRRSFARFQDSEIVSTPNYDYFYMHTDLAKKAFVPIIADVKARTLKAFGPMISHAGEEYCYVLAGEVTVHTEHYSPLIMGVGESVFFDSVMKHAYINSGVGEARVLCISSDPAKHINL